MALSSLSEHFLRKARNLAIAELNLKEYPAFYAKHIISHLDYYVSIYQQVVDLAISATNREISSLTVLDFGCGNGFLGLYAKHLGFKKVWLCDLSHDFLQSAEKTAQAASIKIDGFIPGDINAVKEYFSSLNEQPDIVLSTDVIEHIYDLEHLFKSLKSLNPELVSIFTTASNPYNFRKIKALHKEQYKDEWIGHSDLPEGDLAKKGFSPLSFFEQRKQIIRNEFNQLPEKMVAELARLTRGKALNDILECVRTYLHSGELPHPPEDEQWVCDPYTGSWTERILPLRTYQDLVRCSGFRLQWVNGFYNPYARSWHSAFVVRSINWLIKRSRGVGKFIAPYIVFLVLPAGERNCTNRT